jgi:hypothetical protein
MNHVDRKATTATIASFWFRGLSHVFSNSCAGTKIWLCNVNRLGSHEYCWCHFQNTKLVIEMGVIPFLLICCPVPSDIASDYAACHDLVLRAGALATVSWASPTQHVAYYYLGLEQLLSRRTAQSSDAKRMRGQH